MNKSGLVYQNGAFISPQEAKVSIFDRGFLYGDSIYEVTLTYKGKPFLVEEHLDRLWHSADGIGLSIQMKREELTRIIHEGARKLGLERQYIRIIITRGIGDLGLDPALGEEQTTLILFKELPALDTALYEKGVTLFTSEVLRNPKKSMDPSVKSGNYLNNVLAIKQAREAGAYDAVMLNAKGYVTESTSANIWMVLGESIITPPLEAGLLGGITRQKVMELGKAQGFDIKEQNFTVDTLKSANEVFITSSTREVLPVTQVDNQVIGLGVPGPKTKELHKHYKTFILNLN
ncbi:MAG: aminotransferase class IV [Bdellovibrionota bacterium]|nr:aminotransferase class IV [Bdellovibrionota bacterium]